MVSPWSISQLQARWLSKTRTWGVLWLPFVAVIGWRRVFSPVLQRWRMKKICRLWRSFLLLGCLDRGDSNLTLGRFQKIVTVILWSFHSAYLSTCYPGDLPTPDAKREKVLWSNRGVVSAVKLEMKHLFNICIPHPSPPFFERPPCSSVWSIRTG